MLPPQRRLIEMRRVMHLRRGKRVPGVWYHDRNWLSNSPRLPSRRRGTPARSRSLWSWPSGIVHGGRICGGPYRQVSLSKSLPGHCPGSGQNRRLCRTPSPQLAEQPLQSFQGSQLAHSPAQVSCSRPKGRIKIGLPSLQTSTSESAPSQPVQGQIRSRLRTPSPQLCVQSLHGSHSFRLTFTAV